MAEFEEGVFMTVRKHINAAQENLHRGEFEAAAAAAQCAIDDALSKNHNPSIAAAYYAMASVIWNSGGASEDAHHYASLAAQNTKADTQTDLLVRTLIARLKAARGNYEAAILLNEDLLRYYDREEVLEGRADVLRNLGDVYRAMGDYSLAKEKYYKSLSLYKQLDDPLNHAGLLLSLGALMFQMSDRLGAAEHWQEARSIAESKGYRYILNQIDEALDMLKSS